MFNDCKSFDLFLKKIMSEDEVIYFRNTKAFDFEKLDMHHILILLNHLITKVITTQLSDYRHFPSFFLVFQAQPYLIFRILPWINQHINRKLSSQALLFFNCRHATQSPSCELARGCTQPI